MTFPRPVVPHQVLTISTRTLITITLIVLGIWLVWKLQVAIAIIFVSLLLSALIEPLATWLHLRRIPRGVAVLLVYAVLLLLTAAVALLFIPAVAQQTGELLGNIASSYGTLADYFGRFQTFAAEHGFQENFNASLQSIQESVTQQVTSVFSTVSGFFTVLAALFTILTLTFYMVVEEDAAKKYFRIFAPIEYQPFLSQLVNKMQKKIGAWLRGQIILGLVIGVAVYIGLTILGVPYALLLAVIAGLMEIIPYLGPILSVVPAAIIGFAESPIKGLFVIILYLVIQQLENTVLVPKIMQKVAGLNPVASIVALLFGYVLFGVGGAILAIPVAIMASVVLEELFAERSV